MNTHDRSNEDHILRSLEYRFDFASKYQHMLFFPPSRMISDKTAFLRRAIWRILRTTGPLSNLQDEMACNAFTKKKNNSLRFARRIRVT